MVEFIEADIHGAGSWYRCRYCGRANQLLHYAVDAGVDAAGRKINEMLMKRRIDAMAPDQTLCLKWGMTAKRTGAFCEKYVTPLS